MNTITGFDVAGGRCALDIESAINAMGGSEEAFREVALVFLQHVRESLEAIGRGVSSPAEAQALLHELGSSLGAVGARGLCSRSRELEHRLRNGDAAAVMALGALQPDVEKTIALLQQWLHSRPAKRA